jgi:hypothetical protein
MGVQGDGLRAACVFGRPGGGGTRSRGDAPGGARGTPCGDRRGEQRWPSANCEHAHDEYRAAMHEVCAARAAAATVAGELNVATRAAASSAMRCVELDGEWQLEASAHAEALREVCQQLRTMIGIWRSSCTHRASKPCAWRRSPRS